MPSYRRLVLIFLVVPLLALLAVPLTNIFVRHLPDALKLPWWHRFVLFNMDPLYNALANPLYDFGITVRPGNGFIGREGWLYLGENYDNSMSLHRDAAGEAGRDRAEAARDSVAAWKQWFVAHGVPHVWILVAPDKEDIYPEHMPRWAVPAADNLAEQIRAAADPAVVIDAVADLRAAKPQVNALLFHKTDTHWTKLGGRIGIESLLKRISATDPEFIVPQWTPTRNVAMTHRGDGDLARLMAITRPLEDFDTQVPPLGGTGAEHTDDNVVVPGGAGHDSVTLTRFTSTNPLNAKTVLFLHDSFGRRMTADLSRLFAQTYNGTYDSPTLDAMAEILAQVKPDYVLFTIVDRMTRQGPFKRPPPD